MTEAGEEIDDAADELPEELESEVIEISSWPETRRRAAVEALCERHPMHADMIQVLGGLGHLAGVPDPHRVIRVGSFRVLREVGEGGMGRVFHARRDGEQRDVAIKLIRPDLDSRDVFRRFAREAALLEGLLHPAIAQFAEAGDATVHFADGREMRLPFLAMEFVDGRDLLTFADRHGLSARDRMRLFQRVCEGVAHAHGLGIVHRDIKPSNILVVDDEEVGQPKVLDFGIARAEGVDGQTFSLTASGEQGIMGTARYMSPEQVRGGAKGLSARTDVYSLGVVLFELLSGRMPYEIGTRALPEIARVICETEPLRLGALDPAYRGSRTERVVAMALEKKPARRYADAGELAADLGRVLADRPIRARTPSTIEALRRFASRHRVLVSTAAATLLTLVVGLVFSVRFAFGEARESRKAQRLAYSASLAAASVAIGDGDAPAARQWLGAAPEMLRGFEWGYLSSRLSEEVRTVSLPSEFGERPRSLRFLEDGSLLSTWVPAIGSDLWRIPARASAERRVELLRTWDSPVSVALGPRGQHIAVGVGSLVRVHDVAAVRDSALPEVVKSPGVCFGSERSDTFFHISGDGDTVACIGDAGTRRTLALHEWQRTRGPFAAHVGLGWLASANGTTARCWRIANPELPPVALRSPNREPIVSMAASPNGLWLAIGYETVIGLWRMDRPRPVLATQLFGHIGHVRALAFDRASRRLASGAGDRSVRVWRVDGGEPLHLSTGHDATVVAVAFNPRGDRLASVDSVGRLFVWIAGSEPRVFRTGQTACAIDVDDDVVYAACRGGLVHVFDRLSLEPIATWRGPWGPAWFASCRVSPDGRWLVVAPVGREARVAVLDTKDGRVVAHLGAANDNQRRGVEFSPDGAKLVIRTQRGRISLWRTRTWECLAERDCPPSFHDIAFSKDGASIVVGAEDGRLHVLDGGDLSPVRSVKGHEARINVLRFNDAGTLLASCDRRGGVRLWDWPALTLRHALIGQAGYVLSADFSPDGTRLATGGRDDKVHLLDPEGGLLLVALSGHTGFLSSVVFSTDGELLSGSGDGTVRSWSSTRPNRRVEARRRYRDFVARHRQELSGLLADRANDACPRLAGWATWDERERRIARQLETHLRSQRRLAEKR